jgi:glycosyltransferase involved in cell wall biosynthesis
MFSRPLISVVVPAHNARLFIGETVSSIQRQTLGDWECVVIDDGSADGTFEEAQAAIAGDLRFRVIQQKCQGASAARNRGFAECSAHSAFVTFMDADDVWIPGALQILVDRLKGSPNAVGAHGLAEMIDSRGHPLEEGTFSAFGRRRLGFRDGAIMEWPLGEPTVFETLVWTGPLYPPGLLLARRSAYQKVGLFDERMKLCEDWDMALRLSRQGPLEFLNDVILFYRRHSSNQSLRVRENRRVVRWLHRKTFFAAENSAEQRRYLVSGWRAWQRFKIQEKWGAAWGGLQRGSVRETLVALRDSPVHLFRHVLGFPSGFA